MSVEKAKVGLGIALLLAVTVAAYSNHFQNGFHMDDGHAIVDNVALRDLRNVPRFFRDATTFSALPSNQSYRPLVSTLLALDYRLAHGLQPFWFQLSNFALFSALILLLAFVLRRLLQEIEGSPSAGWFALAGAGCYALHPVNADAVNYIIVSSEIMATLGVVASFALYFAAPGLRRYFVYCLPAALAIMAKPTAAIFPVLFALFRILLPNEKQKSTGPARFLELLPPFLICGSVLFFVPQMTPRTWVAGAANAHDYLVTQPYVALLYFKNFFWPVGLSADYDLKPFVTAHDPRLWVGFAFVLMLGAAAASAAAFKRTRLIAFGLLWFVVALLPTSLFPLAEAMNDYRAFPAYIGIVIALVGAANLLAARLQEPARAVKIACASAVALVFCASAYATFQRNKVWKTEESLWHDVVLKDPRNARGLMTYGITLVNESEFARALPFLRRAQQLAPPYSVLVTNIAIAEDATSQSAAAEQHFQEALRLAPLAPDSYLHYARYLLAHARFDEALGLLHRALELSPTDPSAGALLHEAETRASAAQTAEGDQLQRRRRFAEAIAHYETALRIAPRSTSTLNNLAWTLSTCPDPSLRDGTKALALAQNADQIAGGGSPVIVRTLAAAYAENGRFDDAARTAQRASELARVEGNFALARNIEKDLDFYQRNLPLHPVRTSPAHP